LIENFVPLREALPVLTEWYRENRKSLPWRESPTPYHVWISEIMLQQTRIEAVIPYYYRFLEALPTVDDLARADDDALMKLWQGLGYYSRARNLKKAAEIICRDYGGVLPKTARELSELPGIGAYTAGAISSIAYGQPEPAVDGNVLRVAMRITACDDDIMLPKTRENLTHLLRESYPSGEDAGYLTQGLMELGELVCIPNGEPLCDRCPVKHLCRALAEERVAELPVKAEKKARRMEERTVLLLSCGDKYAIRKRPDGGLLAGLWEFPSFDGKATATETEERYPTAVSVEPCGNAVHIFTHVEWHMTGYRVTLDEESDGYEWKTAEEIREKYAIPTAYSAYLKKLGERKK